MEINTSISTSDLPNVYHENADDKDKSNVFFGKAGVGREIQLFINIKPTVFVGMHVGGVV